jgi:hypothetical protein
VSGGNVNMPPSSDPIQPFSADFIQSGASSLDDFQVDPSIFGSDSGDLNFERDFGQWFTDAGPMDLNEKNGEFPN